ncbi:hypothetical protein B484DRAFT_337098 [Ochromonadaceae sp. CCMP2298]|nr:hypothetical protein B484DRAFT_337098 [Ochromonadaceae sp. CCMP2298]
MGVKGAKTWDWRKDFVDIVRNKAGLLKLNQERPSTASIGNWGILDVTKRLSEAHSLGSYVTARLFMGRRKSSKSKIDVPLARGDSADTVTAQWDALRACLLHPREVLLFHLKNHYALLFAAREWVDAGGTCVRQLLTARKGQRPAAWLDFSEAREVMLGWEGYKIMAISSSMDAEALRRMALPMGDSDSAEPLGGGQEGLK